MKRNVFLLIINRILSFYFYRFRLKMASPALKDLPRVDVTLKSQLEGFKTENLKDVDTQEKVVLPSAEGTSITHFPHLIHLITRKAKNI